MKRQRGMRRLLCLLVCLSLLAGALPAPAFAADPAACTLTEGCTLPAGHEGACVPAEEPAPEETPAAESGPAPQADPAPLNEEPAPVNEPAAPQVGDTIEIGGISYKVTALPADGDNGTLTLTDGKSYAGDLVLANGLEYAGGKYDLTEIAYGAFMNNTALTGADLSGTSVKKLLGNCFRGCSALAKVVLPDTGSLRIENGAFVGCSALTALQLPTVTLVQSPFSSAGIQNLVIQNIQGTAPMNCFSGLPEGLKVTITGSLSSSALRKDSFGSTKKVTLYLPTQSLVDSYTTLFSGKDVTVKLLGGEEEAVAAVTDSTGAVSGYATLKAAIEAINASADPGPFRVSVNGGQGMLAWEGDVAPNKPTEINFNNGSVDLPDTLTLQAPLTLRNVKNFNSEDALCTVIAGDHAFRVVDGGSFGFAAISGSDLTFEGVVPGGQPIGKMVQLTGTGENPTLTYIGIGNAQNYYGLPNMSGFASLVLDKAFMEADCYELLTGQLADVKNVTLKNGAGLRLGAPVTLETLEGEGQLRFTGTGSLTVTGSASGTFTLPDYDAAEGSPLPIELPAGAEITLLDKNGETVPVTGEPTPPAVGDTIEINGIRYKVTALPADGDNGTLTLTDGKSYAGDLVLANGLEYAGGKYDLTEIAYGAFMNNTALTGADLSGTSVKKLLGNCFRGCSALAKVVLPDTGSLRIENGAFVGCSALTALQLPTVTLVQSPFSSAGIQNLVIQNIQGTAPMSCFSGLPEGLKVTITGSLSSSALRKDSFGSTKKVTLYLPTQSLVDSYTTLFSGKDVTVKLLGGEEEAVAAVTDSTGAVSGYATLKAAIEAINASADPGPFRVSVNGGQGMLAWEGDVAPNKPTEINFNNGSVDLPDTLTLQAPLTLRNVKNFNSEDALCTVIAGDHAFCVVDGGSFGFAAISGSNLTFEGVVPGGKPIGQLVRLTGTGENPTLTYIGIGNAQNYYGLPNMSGFASLVLDKAFMEADCYELLTGQLADVKNVTLKNGAGLRLGAPVTLETLEGEGQLRFTGTGSLTVTGSASGTFTLPDYDVNEGGLPPIQLPEGAQVTLLDKNGQVITLADPAVRVPELGRNFASLDEALTAIEMDEGKGPYTVTLLQDAAFGLETGLPEKDLVLDGGGFTLSAPEGAAIYFRDDLTVRNAVLALKGSTFQYQPASDAKRTICFEDTVTGQLGTISDQSGSRWLDIRLEGGLPFEKVVGTTSSLDTRLTDLILIGYGTEQAPLDLSGKVEHLAALELGNSWITAVGDATALGVIRLENNKTGGGLILTGDTTLENLSLYRDTPFQLRIPADATLTMAGDYNADIQITLQVQGTPADGHVLVKVPASYARKKFQVFTMAGGPEGSMLWWNKDKLEFSVSYAPEAAAAGQSVMGREAYTRLELQLTDGQGIAGVEINGQYTALQQSVDILFTPDQSVWQEGSNTVVVHDVTGNTGSFVFNFAKAADYTAVDKALKSIPDNLGNYTDDSVKKLNAAVNAVVRGLEAKYQSEVDAMAKAISDAVAGLTAKPSGGGGGQTQPTPAPTPAPTAAPTATPAPTARPTARPTATPAVTGEEEEETEPTATPAPTETPAPEATEAPDTTEEIPEEETAQAAAGSWALLDLILVILTVAVGLVMLGMRFTGRGGPLHLLGVVPALVAVIAFLITSDLAMPMALTGRWTLLMAGLAVVQLVLLLVGRGARGSEE